MSQTQTFQTPVPIISTASIVGQKEGEGPLAPYFDQIVNDPLFGSDSWEQAESRFVTESLTLAIKKASLPPSSIEAVLAGDLQNQITGATFGIRPLSIPFIGLFGACSTFGLAMGLAASLISANTFQTLAAAASSHFCSAEKQFRFPLEFGSQRPPTASYTVTGCGSAVLSYSPAPAGPCVTAFTPGKIIDMGVTDANNMGAAMAPDIVILGQIYFLFQKIP